MTHHSTTFVTFGMFDIFEASHYWIAVVFIMSENTLNRLMGVTMPMILITSCTLFWGSGCICVYLINHWSYMVVSTSNFEEGGRLKDWLLMGDRLKNQFGQMHISTSFYVLTEGPRKCVRGKCTDFTDYRMHANFVEILPWSLS